MFESSPLHVGARYEVMRFKTVTSFSISFCCTWAMRYDDDIGKAIDGNANAYSSKMVGLSIRTGDMMTVAADLSCRAGQVAAVPVVFVGALAISQFLYE
jgi:hypothetical protein